MPNFEITFKKRFRLRDDQKPEQIAQMYLESMGFEFVDAKQMEDENVVPGSAQHT